MFKRHGRHWKITTVILTNLAARLGVLDDYQAHISRNRRERAAWHVYLDRFRDQQMNETDLHDLESEERWMPPGDSLIWLVA